MRFDVLTLFPEMFPGYLGQSLLKLAIQNGLVEAHVHNIRDWATGVHKSVDDRPFGGGPGMLLKCEPVVACVEAVEKQTETPSHLVMLTPQGRRLTHAVVGELAGHPRLTLLCGRYEGFDERIREILKPDEISLGDYVLNGGEVAAMAIMDAVIRLIPGVLGHEESAHSDSFAGEQPRLEYAQYTRPREFRGLSVPDVLLGGNHRQIAQWREQQSLIKTQQQRADLIDRGPRGPSQTTTP